MHFNNFPSRKDIGCAKLFLETFTYWYNNIRSHQSLGALPAGVSLS